jgi:hypothetical protein
MTNRSEPAVDCAVAALQPLRAQPPSWAVALTRNEPDRWFLASELVTDVAALDTTALHEAVLGAYARLSERLGRHGRHPVRFWNFLPGIHADMGDGLDRYMAFNAGRFAAFCEWFGPAATFNRHVPTASAVGVTGGPLVIHGLATLEAGAPIENPRQVPAYSYSRRYGPLPPCFARATLVAPAGAGPCRLLVGGTASIVGEDSRHERDARLQALETFANLTWLVDHARRCAGVDATAVDPLHVFTDLRVYLARSEDATLVRDLVVERFVALRSIEYAQADLCRRELLVEIEGVAEI